MRPQRVLLLASLLALAPAALPPRAAGDQERARARTQTRESTPARAVRAQPKLEAALLLPAVQASRAAVRPAPPRAEGTPPAPLATGVKQQALGQVPGAAAGSRVAAPSQSLQSVQLDAQRPWSANRAYLSAFMPSKFDPESGIIELNINHGGWIDVNMNVEAGGSYLVDLSTDTWGSGGTWKIEIGDEQLEIEKGPGPEHVLFAVQSPESGWLTARIRREGSGCRLFGVSIDRAN